MNTERLIFLLSSAMPSWVINRTNPPDIAINWQTNQAWLKTGGLTTPAALGITTARASVKQVVDANGNWTQVAANTTATSNLGRSTEEARTNSVRNNTMVGAVVGADNVELTTNGNFVGSLSGWQVATAGGGSVTWNSNGSVTIVGDGVLASHNGISQQITGLVVGRSYIVSIASSVGVTLGVSVGNSAFDTTVLNNSAIFPNVFASASPDRVGFTATATSHWVTLGRSIASAGTINGSVSVQDGERVENGGFTVNPINASQSTSQNGWQWSNNVGTGTVVYNGSSAVTLAGDGTHSAAIGAPIPTIAGLTYTISVDVSGAGSGSVLAGTALQSATFLSSVISGGTGKKYQFTATGSTSWVTFAVNGVTSVTIANVSVQSAGALPSNWGHAGANSSGLIYSVQAVGTQNGVDTIDINWAGTTTNGNFNLTFDSAAAIASANGQTWSNSVFTSLVGGTLTNVSNVLLYAIDVGGGGGVGSGFPIIPTATLTRYFQIGTIVNAGNTNVRPQINPVFTGTGVAVNMTLRIGWPQLELGASVTSPIKTSGAAVTRNADATLLTGQTFGAAYSMFSQVTPLTPIGATQTALQFDDGTSNQRTLVRRASGGGVLVASVGGTGMNLTPAGTMAQNVQAKLAAGFAAGASGGCFNGGTVVTSAAAALPTTPTRIDFGSNVGTEYLNGLAAIDAIWFTTALSSAELVAITT